MSTIGLYVPGTSVLHRLPAGAKVGGLLVAAILVLRLRSVTAICVAAGVVVLLYALGRIGPRPALSQLRPVMWFLPLIGLWQGLTAGWERAFVVCGQLLLVVALAGLVTLTTRVTAMLDLFEAVLRPFERFGVDPARVGLVLAMTIRAVPVLAGIGAEVRDAQRARGLTFAPRAFAVPFVVRTLRHADAMGEALAARGLDD